MEEETQEILDKIKSEIRYDRVSVTFSFEGRDGKGHKKMMHTTASAQRASGVWDPSEMLIVQALVSKQVTIATYMDAQSQGLLEPGEYKSQTDRVRSSLDKRLAKLVRRKDSGNETK